MPYLTFFDIFTLTFRGSFRGRPSVPDTKFRDELIAARRDIVNFANNIKKLQTDQEKRKQLLQSMPVIQKWWKSLFSLVEFLDKKIERA